MNNILNYKKRSSMFLLVVYFIVTLLISFFCSLLESVLLSVTPTYISVMEKEGKKAGKVLHRFKRNIDHPLAAILTMNTVANTVGAALIGAQAYAVFGGPWIAVSSGLLTFFILTFSEITPKTIGAVHWKKLASFGAYSIQGLIIILYPFVKMLEVLSSAISRGKKGGYVSRDEIIAMAEISEKEGVLSRKEASIIENVLLFRELRVEDILTPRSVLATLQRDDTVREAFEHLSPMRFSRIPVWGINLDDIRGVVFRNALVEAYYTGKENEKVESLIKPLHAVPESKRIADVLDEFITRREHMFLVIDEYGGTAGIITLEDVIESLLGMEIVDELDTIVDMRAYAAERWRKRREERMF
jgi:CBS domain containing-hemolysin-like protein